MPNHLPSPCSPAALHGPVALKQAAWFARLDARGIRYDAGKLVIANHVTGPAQPSRVITITDRTHAALPVIRAAIARRFSPSDGGGAA